MNAKDAVSQEASQVIRDAITEERLKKKKAASFKKACKAIGKTLFSTVGLLIINILMMALGAVIFSQLEIDNERQICVNSREDYHKNINSTILLLLDVATQRESSGPLSEEQIGNIQSKFREYMRNFSISVLDTGYKMTKVCEDLGTPNGERLVWDFAGAFFFAATMVTTIGYGVWAPKTVWGRVVCIVYSLISIPIFMICQVNIGGVCAKGFHTIYSTLCCCGCCKKKEKKDDKEITDLDKEYIERAAAVWRLDPVTGRPIPPSEDQKIDGEDEYEDEEEEEEEEKLTVPFLVTVITFIAFISTGGLIFSNLDEGWDFLDAFYFSTITALTIGFGDFAPNVPDSNSSTEEFAVFLIKISYLCFSIAAIAIILALILEEVNAKIDYLKERFVQKKNQEEDDDKEESDDEEDELTEIHTTDEPSDKKL